MGKPEGGEVEEKASYLIYISQFFILFDNLI